MALEGGPSERKHLRSSVVRTPSGGEGLPKVCCWRTSRFGYLCSQRSSVCGSSFHSGHFGLAAGFSKWAYALRSGVCPARRRARRTTEGMLQDCVEVHACSTVCGSSLHSGSNDWVYTLSSDVCTDRKLARIKASGLLEVAMQSAFQEKFSYTMAVRGLLGGGFVMVRRISDGE